METVNSNVLLKVKIITGVFKRSGRSGEVFVTNAIDGDGQLAVIFVPSELTGRLPQDSYRLLMNFAIKVDTVRKIFLTQRSQIFDTTPFPVDESIVQDFLSAPVLQLKTILTLGPEKRVSVSGRVHEIRGCKTGENWSRQDVLLLDAGLNVLVKFWNWRDLQSELNVGKIVSIKNVVTNVFNGIVTLSSTEQTSIEMQNQTTETCADLPMTVEGFGLQGNNFQVVCSNGDVYYMKKDVYDLQSAVFPMRVLASTSGNEIVALKPFVPVTAVRNSSKPVRKSL